MGIALNYVGFVASVWIFSSIGLILTAGRLVIRLRYEPNFGAQDVTQILAAMCLVTLEGFYTHLYPIVAEVQKFGNHKGPAPPPADLETYIRGIVALEFLFWLVLYMVKFTFMFKYREIFSISRNFMLAWRIVMAYLVLAGLASFLTVLWSCQSPTHLFDLQYCYSPNAVSTVDTFAETNVALNIFGDLAVMALPLWMLKGLQMKLAQKFATGFVFLLGFIIIAFDIARIAGGAGGGDVSMAVLWDSLEPAIAVIVSTLPTYRILFTRRRERTKPTRHSVSAFSAGRKKPSGSEVELAGGKTSISMDSASEPESMC